MACAARGPRPELAPMPLTAGAARQAVGAYKKAKAWANAVQLLAGMSDSRILPDLAFYNAVLASCSGVWQVGVRLLTEMHDGSALAPDGLSFGFLGQAPWQQALQLLPGLRTATAAARNAADESKAAVGYNALLTALGRGGQWEKVLALRLEVPCPTVVTYTAALNALSFDRSEASGAWRQVLPLLAAARQQRVALDLMAWNTALKVCGPRMWQEALGMLEEIQSSSARPDIISFTAAITAVGGGGAWQHALNLFHTASKCFRLDAQIYVSALSACADAAAWRSALQLAALEPAPSRAGLGALLRALKGQWPWALRQLRAAKKEQVDTLAYNTVLAALPWDQGLALLVTQAAPDAAGFGAVLSACEALHEWAMAFALLEYMQRCLASPDVQACCSALSACEKGRQWQRCLALLARMWAGLPRPDVVAYGAAVSACEKCGQWRWAVHLLEDLRGHSLQLDQVAGNAALAALQTRWPVALALLGQLQREGLVDLVSFNAAIAAVPWRWALHLAEELRVAQLEPDLITAAGLAQCLEVMGASIDGRHLLRWAGGLERQAGALLRRKALARVLNRN